MSPPATPVAPATHEVAITFRVHAPFANSRDRVWLLGSIHELGEWNPSRAIETGQVESEWKVFQAGVRMPVDAAFHWSWCFLCKDGRIRQWESSQKRERKISSFSGVLHTAWGDPSMEIFQQNMASALLMTKRRTKKGDVVAVVGSSPPLGSWDPSRAVVATEFPRRSGHWSATVAYDGGAMQEWNWVIIDAITKEVKLAEKHKTRFLYDTHGWMKLDAPWNKEAAAVDWAPKEFCGGGGLCNPEPGTVELLRDRKAHLREIHYWEEMAETMRRTGKVDSRGGVTATLQLDRLPPKFPSSRAHAPTGPALEDRKTSHLTARAESARQTALPLELEENYQPVLVVKPFPDKATADRARQQQHSPPVPFPTYQAPPIRTFADVAPPPRPKDSAPKERPPDLVSDVNRTPTAYSQSLPPTTQVRYPPSTKPTPTTPLPVPTPTATPPVPMPSPVATPPRTRETAAYWKPKVEKLDRQVNTVDSGIQPDIEASIQAGREAAANIMRVGGKREVIPTDVQMGHPASVKGGYTKGQVSQTAAKKASSPTPSETSIRSRGQEPVDMSMAGYRRTAEEPTADKGKRNLVSDPGRPGYSKEPSHYPGSPPEIAAPMLDADALEFHADIREHRQSVVIPPGQSGSGSSFNFQRFSSPPVRKAKVTEREIDELQQDEVGTVSSGTSIGSTVGILGVELDNRKPSLDDLRQMSEQREMARTSERIKGVMSREERNKTKFEENKQLEFKNGSVTRSKKSKAQKADQATDTADKR